MKLKSHCSTIFEQKVHFKSWRGIDKAAKIRVRVNAFTEIIEDIHYRIPQ